MGRRILNKGYGAIYYGSEYILTQLGGDVQLLLIGHVLQQQLVNGMPLPVRLAIRPRARPSSW